MKDLLRILVAPLVWLAAFTALYGLHGLFCGHGVAGTAMFGLSLPRLLLATFYLLAMALQAVILAGLYSARFGSPSRFVRFVSTTTGWAGLVSTAWTMLPAVVTTYCASL